MSDSPVESSNLVDIVYRDGVPGADDPSENYFEASKLYANSVGYDVPGAALLERSPEARTMTSRGARRYASRPIVALPECASPSLGLPEALNTRRSAEVFGDHPVSLDVLASLLLRSYGVSGWLGEHALRPTPSAGALYPLDVFVAVRNVSDLRAGGLYHFDPYREGLADLDDIDLEALGTGVNMPELSARAAMTLVISASFWRSRFKYGQRALRFALMESGHLVQNLLLLATAHGLATRPLGGFLDAQVTELLPEHNGVDDAPVYTVLIGSTASS